MNTRWFTIIVFAVLAFVLLVGGDIFMGASKGQKIKDMDEPPVFDLPASSKKSEPARPAFSHTQWSEAEVRYQKAMDAVRDDERKVALRKSEKEKIEDFLISEAGKLFEEGIQLMREGKKDEARQKLVQCLESQQNLDFSVLIVLMKALVRTYFQPEDHKTMDESMLKYLKLIKGQYTQADFQKTVQEVVDRIQEKIARGGQ